MSAISFNMIVRGQPEAVSAAMGSIYENLWEAGDEFIVVDTGSSPEDLQAIKAVIADCENAKLIERPDLAVNYTDRIDKWLPNCREEWGDATGLRSFAEARNVALDASSKTLVFWIDSDDVVTEVQPGALRSHINEKMPENFADSEIGNLFLEYEYAFGEDGVLTTVLKRERCFYRTLYRWVGNCHETAIPRPGVDAKRSGFISGLGTTIRHTEARKPHRMSDIRNYVILREELENTQDNPDARTLFYLANAARGLGRFAESISLYRLFLELSGSRDDRFAAAYYIGQTYMDPSVRRPIDAMDAFRVCIDIRPDDPRGYLGLSRGYLVLRRWEDCLREYNRAKTLKINTEAEVHSLDPTHISYHPHIVASIALKELGRAEEAAQTAQLAVQTRPDLEDAREHFLGMARWAGGELLADSVIHVLNNLEHRGPNAVRVGREIIKEFPAVPPKLEKSGLGKTEPPDPRESEFKASVAIFCGQSHETWGPSSAETGIGGSEKMVILLSKALQSTGLANVSVYAEVHPEERGIDKDTGVMWRHWSELDTDRPRDVLVLWRMPALAASLPIPATKRIVWMHDVPRPDQWTQEVIACTDLVNVQSKYHADLLRGCGVPREKIWVARNAIDGAQLEPVAERNPKQVVFFSSPDRGLLSACQIVKAAQKLDPEISLVAAYGINPWARVAPRHRSVPDVGHDVDFDLYERRLFRGLDAVGGRCLNRISFDEVKALLRGSGAWLYPTRFPEISCMAAMEAQAFGVIPVTTGYGALKETVLDGPQLSPVPPGELRDDYVQQCALALYKATRVAADSKKRVKLAEKAWAAYNIDDLAQNWLNKILPGLDTCSGGRVPDASAVRASSQEELSGAD